MIREDQGINPSNFINSEFFKLEISQKISEIEDKASQLVNQVASEVLKALEMIVNECFTNFDELAN